MTVFRFAPLAGQKAPTSSSWTPTTLGSPLVIWVDASDTTTVTTSSGLASQINDKSGNARDMKMTLGSNNYPSYVSNAQNGRSVLRFDGSNDALRSDTAAGTGISAQPFTVALAFKAGTIVSTTQYLWQLGIVSTLGVNSSGYLVNSGSPRYRGTPDANWHVIVSVYDGATSPLWVDGSSLGSPSATIGTGTGTRHIIGATSSSLNGDIGEFMAISGSLSLANRQKVEGYLAHRWGLTGNLPNSHPYKSSAP